MSTHATHSPATLDPSCTMPGHGRPDAPSPCCRPPVGVDDRAPVPHPPSAVAADATPLWRRAAQNTLVCLTGCTIGDVGVVVAAAIWFPHAPMLPVMALAIVAGLATSILLETLWLATRGHSLREGVRMALGMSLVSMIGMELAMNAVDLGLGAGGPMHLGWGPYLGVLALGEVAGFAAAYPYNLWRLRHGRSCH